MKICGKSTITGSNLISNGFRMKASYFYLKLLKRNVGNKISHNKIKSARRVSMNSGNMIRSHCLKIVGTVVVLKVHGLKESTFKSQNNFYLGGLNSLGSQLKFNIN